jgi:hypothetical protein
MSDFSVPTPLHLGSFSSMSAVMDAGQYISNASPGTITWVANLGVYIPIVIPYPYPVRRVWWQNGSTVTSAHCDVGVYTPDGQRIVSAGTTVQAGASTVQYASVTETLLAPGKYFFAFVCDTATSHAFGLSTLTVPALRSAGILQQASALPLPATATFAVASSAVYPWCGITRTSSGF